MLLLASNGPEFETKNSSNTWKEREDGRRLPAVFNIKRMELFLWINPDQEADIYHCDSGWLDLVSHALQIILIYIHLEIPALVWLPAIYIQSVNILLQTSSLTFKINISHFTILNFFVIFQFGDKETDWRISSGWLRRIYKKWQS